jgi:hypothetical protein
MEMNIFDLLWAILEGLAKLVIKLVNWFRKR